MKRTTMPDLWPMTGIPLVCCLFVTDIRPAAAQDLIDDRITAERLVDDRRRGAGEGPGVDRSPDGPASAPQEEIAKPPPQETAAQTAVREEVQKLIEQLGDTDFRVREAASKRLRQIGQPAVAALEAARKQGNAEVASRADALIGQVRRRPSLLLRSGRDIGAVHGQRVRISVFNGARVTEVFDGHLRVQITSGPRGVEVAVSGFNERGQQVTERFSAGSPQELKAKHPDAYALYERWSVHGAARIPAERRVVPQLLRPHLLPPGVPGPLLIRPGLAPVRPGVGMGPHGDDLDGLRANLQQQMQEAKLPANQRRRVFEKLDGLQEIQHQPVELLDAAGETEKIRDYNQRSDELRQLLAELTLPDPGEALPPPAKVRLGVSVGGELGDGVVVTRVLPGSRAEKIGIRAGDVIRRVNDKPVPTAQSLRRLVTAAERPLVFDILRGGERLNLKERP